MTRARALALVACVGLGPALMACSSAPSASTPVQPGCHTTAATVHLALSDQVPVPVVRIAPGGCVAVAVPRSPFPQTPTEPLRVAPGGRLRLVSDSLLANGTRAAYYTALGPGTATLTTSVAVRTARAVPEWSGLVVIV